VWVLVIAAFVGGFSTCVVLFTVSILRWLMRQYRKQKQEAAEAAKAVAPFHN
jgi:hypothetical protein